MHVHGRGPTALALMLAVGLGCAADDEGGPAAGETEATSDGSTSSGPMSPDDVPREPLIADPAVVCPGEFAVTAPQGGDNRGFVSAEQDRNFWLMLPDELGPEPHPIFFAFNGTGDTGQLFSVSSGVRDFTKHGFIVVAPSSNANGTVWPVWDALRTEDEQDLPNADVTYFDELLQCLAAHYPVDANRIYVGGHSAGGHMAHYLLQRRSDVIAGAIPASGVFSLTTAPQQAPLEESFVLVTWGGDNDEWSGDADAAGISVPPFNFVEQAALATQFYAAEPNVGFAHCSADLGHAWLTSANDWMAQVLLAHPKGMPGADGVELPPAPAGVECSNQVYEYDLGVSVTCVGGEDSGCQTVCQAFGDCVVENATVASVLEPQLPAFGFSGEGFTECGGCIAHCETVIDGPDDGAVLECIRQADPGPQCGPGIEGALVLPDVVNMCCDGQTQSSWCADTCSILRNNTAVLSFFEVCAQFE